jgi:hypothetical protein
LYSGPPLIPACPPQAGGSTELPGGSTELPGGSTELAGGSTELEKVDFCRDFLNKFSSILVKKKFRTVRKTSDQIIE